MAPNVADVEPASTVTEAGRASSCCCGTATTTLPPVEAALDRVTVQVLEALGPSDLVGAHCRPVRRRARKLPGSRSQWLGGASQGSGDGGASDRW